VQDVILNRQLRVGGDGVDRVRLDAHPVDDFNDWHRGRAGQDADHQAVVMGLEMLNQHEGQAGVGWHRGDQVDESIQPPGRGTDSNDAHSPMES